MITVRCPYCDREQKRDSRTILEGIAQDREVIVECEYCDAEFKLTDYKFKKSQKDTTLYGTPNRKGSERSVHA